MIGSAAPSGDPEKLASYGQQIQVVAALSNVPTGVGRGTIPV